MMRNLILLKPDAFQQKRIGWLLHRINHLAEIVDMKMVHDATSDTLKSHYFDHKEKDFFPSLIAHMQSGPFLALLIDMGGKHNHVSFKQVVKRWREQFECVNPANLIHASDSLDDALREERIWFP